jgi:hypothetical protein
MLQPLRLVDQFNRLEGGVVDEWSELRLALTVDDAECTRAVSLLAPANPGRSGKTIRFHADRSGPGVGPEAVRRLLRRLDENRIDGRLSLVAVERPAVQEEERAESLHSQWDRHVAEMPSDWSDLYGEVRLESTDYVERAALLLAPLNPSRAGSAADLRFRCAHHFGYGTSPEMAARCFERCDDDGITGAVEILHVLSDTHPVATQGPVWRLDGRAV